MRIKGLQTNLYLAMNKNGKLYGEVNEVHSNRRIGILTCREKAKIVLSFFFRQTEKTMRRHSSSVSTENTISTFQGNGHIWGGMRVLKNLGRASQGRKLGMAKKLFNFFLGGKGNGQII